MTICSFEHQSSILGISFLLIYIHQTFCWLHMPVLHSITCFISVILLNLSLEGSSHCSFVTTFLPWRLITHSNIQINIYFIHLDITVYYVHTWKHPLYFSCQSQAFIMITFHNVKNIIYKLYQAPHAILPYMGMAYVPKHAFFICFLWPLYCNKQLCSAILVSESHIFNVCFM